MSVNRLPLDYIKIHNNNLKYNRWPLNMEEKLKDFHKSYLQGSDEIDIGYADVEAVLIRTYNSLSWSKKDHEVFCHHFSAILVSFDRVEHYEPRKYALELDFLYVPKFENEHHNEMFSVNINDILR